MGPSAPANLESPQSWLARANADRVELRQEGVFVGPFSSVFVGKQNMIARSVLFGGFG